MTSKTTTAGSDADRQAVLDVLARLYQAWEAATLRRSWPTTPRTPA